MTDAQLVTDLIGWAADDKNFIGNASRPDDVPYCIYCAAYGLGRDCDEFDHDPDCLHLRAKAARDEMARPPYKFPPKSERDVTVHVTREEVTSD